MFSAIVEERYLEWELFLSKIFAYFLSKSPDFNSLFLLEILLLSFWLVGSMFRAEELVDKFAFVVKLNDHLLSPGTLGMELFTATFMIAGIGDPIPASTNLANLPKLLTVDTVKSDDFNCQRGAALEGGFRAS